MESALECRLTPGAATTRGGVNDCGPKKSNESVACHTMWCRITNLFPHIAVNESEVTPSH